MLCGETTFTREEIIKLLAREGIQQGTAQFVETFNERYMPTDEDRTLFIERPDWNPKPSKPRSFAWDVVG